MTIQQVFEYPRINMIIYGLIYPGISAKMQFFPRFLKELLDTVKVFVSLLTILVFVASRDNVLFYVTLKHEYLCLELVHRF